MPMLYKASPEGQVGFGALDVGSAAGFKAVHAYHTDRIPVLAHLHRRDHSSIAADTGSKTGRAKLTKCFSALRPLSALTRDPI